MRVLITEDEVRLARNIAKALTEEAAYAVDISTDGEDGLHMAVSNPYDLLILDLMLPKIGGLQILARLRARNIQTPVLILTARDSVEDVMKGLNTGSDDYMTKPFDMGILIARCQALIRRSYRQPSPLIQVGHVVIDTNAHSVRCKQRSVALSAMEYRLLEYLARRSGELVSKTDIEEHLYDFGSEKFSNVVEVYISSLRKKLEVDPDHRLIHTLRNQGYLFGESGE